jgi:hypothetical protein
LINSKKSSFDMSFFDGTYLFGEGANYYSEETVNYNYDGDNVGPSHPTYDEGDGCSHFPAASNDAGENRRINGLYETNKVNDYTIWC